MTKTVFITGTSSGIGKATADLFVNKGWNVVATMRNPEDGKDFADKPNVLVTELDVLKPESIQSSLQEALDKFGKVDVLINNAGYGAWGPLEESSSEKIRRQFDVNVIGLLDVTKALIPHFRENNSGVIINISSVGGKATFPLGSLYHGTKWAVEGISEALSYEMSQIGVKVKIIEPGGVTTDFGGRSLDISSTGEIDAYKKATESVVEGMSGSRFSEPEDIAQVIFQAATDESPRLRYIAGADAEEMLKTREQLGDEAAVKAVSQMFGLS